MSCVLESASGVFLNMRFTLVDFDALSASRALAVHAGTASEAILKHFPNEVSSGFVVVSINGSSVHGRMYTHSRRAFSSGESEPCGTLAYDHVGRCGLLRFSQHQQ